MPDPLAANDCGEMCACIVIWGRTRVFRSELRLRLQLGGHAEDARTTALEVAHMLQLNGVPAEVPPMNRDGVKSTVIRQTKAGVPTILLGYFVAPGYLHWIVGIGYGRGGAYAIDPWRGRLVHFTWNELHSLATGDMVRILR